MKQPTGLKVIGAALVMSSLLILPVQAAPGPGPDGSHHEIYRYPSRGAVVDRLPRDHRVVNFRGHPYHFHKGIWYRPVGSRFMVVTPPPGTGGTSIASGSSGGDHWRNPLLPVRWCLLREGG